MDIWNWVEKLQGDLRQAGQAQNAHLLNRLADEVSELQIDRVDALLPEARALGKALDNPWVDVYVGHWALRNRVGNRVEGESALGEAVSLFERAHREDTLECPQSICVTQDLAACYGNIDGPGWVPERIEVCDETLGRIDPSWACFQCLSCEKADALLDDGRGQEALDYLQAQADAVEACGKEVFDSFPEMQIKILLAVGRADEALALIEKREAEVAASGEYEPANCTVPRRLSKAWALAQLGRDEEALQQLVPWSELTPNYWRLWANTAAALCQRDPARNTWDLGTRFNTIIEHFARVGSHRLLIEVAALSLELALQRGARWVALRQLELARTHLAQLRQMGAGQFQLAQRHPARTTLQGKLQAQRCHFDQQAMRSDPGEVLDDRVEARAQVPRIARRVTLAQRCGGVRPQPPVIRGQLAPRHQLLQRFFVAAQLGQRPCLGQAARHRAVGRLVLPGGGHFGFALLDQRQCLVGAADSEQDLDLHLREAVEHFLATGLHGVGLRLQVIQRLLATAIVEQRIGFLAAQALEAGPAGIDAAEGLVAHLDALGHPARAIDVAVAGGQVLGHADRLRAFQGVFAVCPLEQRNGFAKCALAFNTVADAVAQRPVADVDVDPGVVERLAQCACFGQQCIDAVDLQFTDLVGEAVQQVRVLRLAGLAQVALQFFDPVPDVHGVSTPV